VRCKIRAQIHPNRDKRNNKRLHDKRDKNLQAAPRFTYKNNKYPLQTAYFRLAGHGTKIANWQVSTTSPGTPHAGLQHQ
jgi:hypothetical protein